MPIRRQKILTKKHTTLEETLNWIAFDDFGGPPLHPLEAQMEIFGHFDDGNVESYEIAIFERKQDIEDAREDYREGRVKQLEELFDV